MAEATMLQEIEAAKNGSEQALAAIIARQMPCIRRVARRSVRPGLDFEDAVQEGIIGLFHAIQHFNTGGGAAFQTFAGVCIQNAVTSASRAAGRKKHAPLNQSVPYSKEQTTPGPEERAIAHEEVSLTLEKAKKALSPFEKTVLRLVLAGNSHEQIAKKLGKDRKSIENALLRARKKLR